MSLREIEQGEANPSIGTLLRLADALDINPTDSESCRSRRGYFGEVAARWLADFETKVAAGERRNRTYELYRSQYPATCYRGSAVAGSD